MNSLAITREKNNYSVKNNESVFESRDITGILENAFIAPELKEDAERLLSILFNELNAEYVSLGGAGEWWYATATVPVIKNYTNKYYDVESYDPFSALAALEAAVRNGWDDDNGLNTIDRFLTWSWFV